MKAAWLALVVACGPPPQTDLALERACALAGGNARANEAWLAPGHPRREDALLLLSRDAAWAPVCARDRAAGALLRSEIDADLATADASNAGVLARRLVVLLEGR